MSRNKARILAMQAIFHLDTYPEMIDRVIDEYSPEEELTEADMKYLSALKENVIAHRAEIDETIQRLAIDWDLSRLGKVDRAILRLAIGEILYVEDVPVSVAINEAVRNGKKYGSEASGKFINGILGRFARECLPDDHPEKAGS